MASDDAGAAQAIESIAFVGAGGSMGLPMARNLARAGFEVRAWDRSPDKAEPLAEDGARVARTVDQAFDGAGALVTMLVDADAIAETLGDGALGHLRDGAVWIQMSTVGVDGTDRLGDMAAEAGIVFVDAPVLGTTQPAAEAELVVLGSGPDEVRERVQPVFDALGKNTLWVGEAGTGTRLKLVTNAWLVAIVEGAAEAIALAEALGLDPRRLLEAVEGGPLDMPYLELKATAMIERKFEPSFRLALAAKDARLAEEAAAAHGADLPMLELIRRRLEEGAEHHGDDDIAATYLTSAET